MDKDHFDRQLQRLRTQWPHSYGLERTVMLWKTFRELSNETFLEMVEHSLAALRSAPLAEDLAKVENEIRERKAKQRWQTGQDRGMLDYLKDMAKNTKLASKEMMVEKIKLLEKLYSGEISKGQFDEGLDFMGQLDGRCE